MKESFWLILPFVVTRSNNRQGDPFPIAELCASEFVSLPIKDC